MVGEIRRISPPAKLLERKNSFLGGEQDLWELLIILEYLLE